MKGRRNLIAQWRAVLARARGTECGNVIVLAYDADGYPIAEATQYGNEISLTPRGNGTNAPNL